MIVVSDLTKRFRTGGTEVTAIDGVSVEIAEASMVAISGPSGSGKSTLLHLIGAIETADSGTITVGGLEVTALRRGGLASFRRNVGFVFQRYHLIPTLTALDNVVAPLIPQRVRFDKAARAREVLAAVGLQGRESSVPGQLSGGQQQRVAIARALVASPGVILADEPTGNLDSATGGEILELLARLRAEHGTTVLIATHEQHVAAACDRMIRLRDGRLVDDLDLSGGEPPESTLARVSGLRLT
ncbi:MAG TPA: ABC transporter ATP-binding protein [Candidatus Limnocylindrales bacterium]